MSVTLQQFETTFSAMLAGEVHSWAQIGTLLHQGEEVGYWKKQYSSFSDWLKKLSVTLDLKEASLWRYLAAVRFYQQITTTLQKRGVNCPDPSALPDSVSPENLELLAKLSRAVPEDLLPELAERVMEGTITRAELRKTWSAYRPALGGRTARGKGVPIPRIIPSDPDQYQSIIEAQIFTTLSSSGHEWIGITKPAFFEFYMRVKPVFPEDVRERFEFDAVIMVGATKRSIPVFHGIEIRGGPFLVPVELILKPRIPYCDYLWVATSGGISTHRGEIIVPEYIGLLLVQDGVVEVKQYPRPLQDAGRLTGELAKGLLLRSVRR